jgi:hypothetical protein
MRIWSLGEIMRQYRLWHLVRLAGDCATAEMQANENCKTVARDQVIPAELAQYVSGMIERARKEANDLTLTSTHDRVFLGEDGSPGGIFPKMMARGITWQELQSQVRVLRECIENDLNRSHFVHIEPSKANVAVDNTARKDWTPVTKGIPGATFDIGEALFCYLLERNTASVFHSMRVAEYGLRFLAKRLKVKLTDKKSPMPIEYADWQKVIVACKNKTEAIAKKPQGPKRQAQLELYSDAADHCVFMKDIWRNNVSHARKPYSPEDALLVIARVRDFLRFLVTTLDPPRESRNGQKQTT